VFIGEQQVPEAMEWDGLDEGAWHFLATDGAGQPIGTARLLDTGQIGRMAVMASWRRRGVGSALLKCALQTAESANLPTPFLHAQLSAEEFYRRFGFVTVGDEFEEAGIAHCVMCRAR
jgi:predicted GNAT family N-acyltransferase